MTEFLFWRQEAHSFQVCADFASCQRPPGNPLLLILSILFYLFLSRQTTVIHF